MPYAIRDCFVRAGNMIIPEQLPEKLGLVLYEINVQVCRSDGVVTPPRGLGLLYGEKSNRGESAPIALFTASQQILAGCMASPVSSYKSRASKRAHAAEISIRFSKKLKSAEIAALAIGKIVAACETLSRVLYNFITTVVNGSQNYPNQFYSTTSKICV